jgi:hypothetical protein
MKTPEINLKTKTKRITEYSISEMQEMFGKRISKAVFESKTDNNRIYNGLIAKEMSKICKWWKFWNRDICKAYKLYVGLILAPFTIVYEDTQVFCDNNMIVTKELKNRYKINNMSKSYEKND